MNFTRETFYSRYRVSKVLLHCISEKRGIIPFLVIATVGSLIYWKTLFFGLTYLDDNVWIMDYGWILKDFSNAPSLFLQPDLISNVFYRPILGLSFMLNAQIPAATYWVYHAANIGLHIFNACILLALLKQWGYGAKAAFIFALIFLVHPVLTSAVAWIPGRTDSLLATFVLLSFFSFLVFLEKGNGAYYLLHIIAGILALLTKETAIILPVLCLSYGVFIAQQQKSIRSWAVWGLTWFTFILALFVIRKMILPVSNLISLKIAAASIAENSPSLISYLGKVLLPLNLSVLPINQDTSLIFGLGVMAGLIGLITLTPQRKWRRILFGAAWFLFFLSPSLLLSFINHEYRLYLPMIGILIILLETKPVQYLLNHRFSFLMTTVLVGVLSVATFFYSNAFKNQWTYWTTAVKHSPHSPLAHRNLGAMHHLEGRLDTAEKEYKTALTLNPLETMAHNNLGLIYATQNRLGEAEQEYKLEIQHNPTYENVYYNLGLLYYKQGKRDWARDLWKNTIRLNPHYIDAYQSLAMLYAIAGDYRQSAFYVREIQRRGVAVPESLRQVLRKAGQ